MSNYNEQEAHSVLFDTNENYQAKDSAYYQQEYTNYDDVTYPADYSQYQGQAFEQQSFNYTNQYQQDNQFSLLAAFGSGGLPGEPPLLEELGINFEHVKAKTFAVLNPFKTMDTHMMDDADLVGPLIFCLLLGFSMVFIGKVQFGYIYGVAMLGWISMYGILNLMSINGVDLIQTASVLGYCLLPIVLLGLIGLIIDLTSIIGVVLAPIIIAWATYAASTIFVTVLHMQNQRFLVAYPIALLYTCFSLITIF